MRNKILFVLICLCVLLNVADVVTTQYIISGEANPLYILTGSLLPVYLLKFFICAYFIWKYYKNKYTSVYSYYSLILILVYINIALAFAQYLNINAIMNPQILEVASQATDSQKVSSYVWLMNILYMFPIIVSYIVFVLYEKSRGSIVIKEKKKWKWLFWNRLE